MTQPSFKKVAPAPLATKSKASTSTKNPLFESTPKNFGIGQSIQPKETCPDLLNGQNMSDYKDKRKSCP